MRQETLDWIKKECNDGFIRFINSPNVNLAKMIAKGEEEDEDSNEKETI